jgi:hypothetical protein
MFNTIFLIWIVINYTYRSKHSKTRCFKNKKNRKRIVELLEKDNKTPNSNAEFNAILVEKDII